MATLTLTFNGSLNTSVQVGDIGYFTETSNNVIGDLDFDANYQTPNTAPIQLIGPITSITQNTPTQTVIEFEIDSHSNIPNLGFTSTLNLNNYFIMFAKDNSVNLSDVLGYYTKLYFKNDSTEKAELFSVGVGITESSK